MTKTWLGLFIPVGFGLVLSAPSCADMPRQQDASQRSDNDTSLEELQSSAEQGYAEAQYNLGFMYRTGQGVPLNYIQAYMWNSLAAAQGLKIAIRDQYVLESFITPEQLAEAQRLAREWRRKNDK